MVGRVAVGAPVNGIVEVAGPQPFHLDEFIREGLHAHNDPRTVVADPRAGYFGVEVDDRALLPGNNARLGETRFETWLSQSAKPVATGNSQEATVGASRYKTEAGSGWTRLQFLSR
jgi:hypothetical protein